MKNRPNKKEEHAALPADLLRDIARLKGRAAAQQDVTIPASVLYPVSSAIAAEESRKEESFWKALEEAMPGQEFPGHGIFIGAWQPEGLSLRFNIFAAKEDLTDTLDRQATFKYGEAVQRIAELKDWNGFNGTHYETDQDLYKALANGSYVREGSGWFIPPCELLTGAKADELASLRMDKPKIIQPDNLYDYRKNGALRGSFCKKSERKSDGFNYPGCYWSSTTGRKNPLNMHIVSFSTGKQYCFPSATSLLSCRPVRLELAS